jgi:hypothetical protein
VPDSIQQGKQEELSQPKLFFNFVPGDAWLAGIAPEGSVEVTQIFQIFYSSAQALNLRMKLADGDAKCLALYGILIHTLRL